MKMRILIVDDHELVRVGVRFVLAQEPGLEVVGEAATGPDALRLCQELRPDLVVMDIRLGVDSGIDVSREILQRHPGTRIVILSAYPDAVFVDQAVAAGVSGYLLKSNASSDLLQAIRAAAAGKHFLSADVASAALSNYRELLAARSAPARPALSERERDVLKLIVEGLRTKEIAARLNLGVKTVETHRARLMRKLNCQGVVELAKYALREGLASL